MGRGKRAGTALAVNGAAALDASKPTITMSDAIQRVKTLAGEAMTKAADKHKTQIAKLEATVGGQAKRVDESVIQQAEQLMARIALISKAKQEGYSAGASQLDGIVKKMGQIVGELKAFMLTNRSAGLFEQFNEHDYASNYRPYPGSSQNPLLYAGPKVRKAAKDLLDGFNIVEDPRKGGTLEESERIDLEALHQDAEEEDPSDDEFDLNPDPDA